MAVRDLPFGADALDRNRGDRSSGESVTGVVQMLVRDTAKESLAMSRELGTARANVANYIQSRQQMLKRGVPHEEALRFASGSL